MEAGPLSIKKIFSQDRRHLVPLFQRPYVWDKERQWEPLWEDIRVVADRLACAADVKPHFLGAIVLDQVLQATGKIETRLVVDGQQRLTTLQIMLEAFCDLCSAEGLDKHHKALLKLTRNDDPMSEDPDEDFKVWPTNQDREAFRQVMRCESAADLRKMYGSKPAGHPIADAYLYFYAEMQQWLALKTEGAEDRLEALLNTMRDYIRLVVIDLDKDDDAQLIFETLNARGTQLLPSDLVKNLLFHRAQRAKKAIEPLYANYWKPFDDEAPYWREEIGRGHAQRARIDLFLQYYLTAQIKDEVPVSHLYVMFRDFVQSNGDPEDVLRSVRHYAKVYRSFWDFEEASKEQVFFARLDAQDVTTAYPFLLELFANGTGRAEILKVLGDVESFLVRRMICQLNTRGYNRLFTELLKRLGNGVGPVSERVREYLLSSDADSVRWPKDDEFKTAWMTSPLFRALAQKRVRLVLAAIEQRLRTGKTESMPLTGKLTIEHILPQDWQKHWPLQARQEGAEDPLERRERLIHSLANLTLLTGSLNPSVSNGPWESKRQQIKEHSLLRLNNDLCKHEVWNEDCIEDRGRQLFDLARAIWTYPG